MKYCASLFAALLAVALHSASAFVVKEPGEFPLGESTKLIVTAEKQNGVPIFKYLLQQRGENGEVLSTDSLSTQVKAGRPIVFFWDNAKRILWWGSDKFLVSIPAPGEKPGEQRTAATPTVWETSGAWRSWNPDFNPCGKMPDTFHREVAATFKH